MSAIPTAPSKAILVRPHYVKFLRWFWSRSANEIRLDTGAVITFDFDACVVTSSSQLTSENPATSKRRLAILEPKTGDHRGAVSFLGKIRGDDFEIDVSRKGWLSGRPTITASHRLFPQGLSVKPTAKSTLFDFWPGLKMEIGPPSRESIFKTRTSDPLEDTLTLTCAQPYQDLGEVLAALLLLGICHDREPAPS